MRCEHKSPQELLTRLSAFALRVVTFLIDYHEKSDINLQVLNTYQSISVVDNV